jgi:hypothetical protein
VRTFHTVSPRTPVNKARNRRSLAASQFAPTANKRLYFVDERQQGLKRWVEPPPAPPAEAGLGRFVGLRREPVPRRPPPRIHGVRATRNHEVGVEALVENYPAMDLLELGKRLCESRAAVLSFNYDTIIENMIEMAAGDNDAEPPRGERVSDEQLSYSDSNWNRALAYGVRFDEVELQQSASVLEPVSGDRFYGHPDNALYDPPLLKLHGSLNWFVHTSRRTYPQPYGVTTNPKEGQTVLTSGYPWLAHGFGKPDRDGWVLEPIVVTPVLYKELVDEVLVGESWRRAREELSECRRLVVGGYSFPPSDFAMSKLFLEAFVDGPPEELVSINPDPRVAGRAAELCHFGRTPLIRENLEEYLEHP